MELGALMLQFYPGESSDYIPNAEFAEKIVAFKLDNALVEAVKKSGRIPSSGDVKKIYFTKSGPGPQRLGPERSTIDPITGLNTYTK